MARRQRVEVHPVVDEGLGHSSYVVGLGDGTALVVDPARFVDRQRSLAGDRGWDIAWAADTHSHADYISGAPALAADGAQLLASQGACLAMAHCPLVAGESVDLADGVVVRTIATPGHTPDHLAYLLVVDGEAEALFSGGSLMVGALGRTDLLGADQAEPLARQLFQALQREILTLPDDLPVYPTHGAGSFCAAPAGVARTTTIGTERATNRLLGIGDEDRFVVELLGGMGSFPSYFRELPERNRLGPRLYPAVPALARLDLTAFREHVDAGAVVVDARRIRDFGAGHVPGWLSIEHRPVFASWLGWLVPLDRPIVFVLDDDVDRTDVVRQALTVGHENLVGELDGGLAAWTGAGLPVATIGIVDPAGLVGTVVDVRQRSEWADGHVPDAVHAELGSLATTRLPDGPLTVMCGHGERAMTGASILTAAGHGEVKVLAGGPSDWAAVTGQTLRS